VNTLPNNWLNNVNGTQHILYTQSLQLKQNFGIQILKRKPKKLPREPTLHLVFAFIFKNLQLSVIVLDDQATRNN
jgi:hypothetical protein